MLSCLDGILLCRQSECVISHRMKHIEAAQTLVTAIDVARDISERMADMKSGSRRIREHVKHIVFRLGTVYLCLECMVGSPE